MSEQSIPMIALNQAEAAELAECCEFLAQWLTAASPAVAASLDARIGMPGSLFEVRDDLIRFSQLLVSRRPTP
jgi:hypothetical protein